MPRASSYQLTPQLVATHGGAVLCLHEHAVGCAQPLYASRPVGATAHASPWHGAATLATRLDGGNEPGRIADPSEPNGTPVTRVDIRGALAKEAGSPGPCAEYVDGHDAVAERMIAALEDGDVLLVIDSPGGAGASLFPHVAEVQAAKDRLGRHVIAYVPPGGMLCSASLAWGTVADETYCASDATIGSIGARGSHTSIAGMLAIDGVEVTYSYWPGPGKIANAPEMAQTPEAKRRADRDVAAVGEVFGACVLASAANVRRVAEGGGLTMDGIVALDADTRIGEAAVGLLVDGVETMETVIAYALALSQSENVAASTTGAASATNKGDRAMGLDVRAEGAPPDKKDGEGDNGPVSERGIDIPTKCAACSVENDKDAKFCKGCGESMATQAAEEPEPPSSRRGAQQASVPERMTAPAKMNADATLASILGATSDTPLAIKTAAIGMRYVRDTAAGVFRKTSADEIVGSMLAVPEKLARGQKAATELDAVKRKVEGDERWKLAHRLAATGAIKRSKVFADVVTESGDRVLVNGKPAIRIRSAYAHMPIGTLRSLAADLEKDAPARPRSPFEPDPAAAEKAAGAAQPKPGQPTPAQIEAAKQHPNVIAAASRSGNNLSIDKLAEMHARLFLNGAAR